MARAFTGRSFLVLALFAGFLASVTPALAVDIVIPGLTTAKAVTPGERLFTAGLEALGRNDLVAADAAFKESLKIDPMAAGAWMGVAQVAMRRNQKDAAEAAMKKALQIAPNTASIQTTWGTYLYSQRELPEAEAALRKATALDPKLAAAHIQLGDLYLTAFRRTDDAITEYRSALAVAPSHAGARYALGLALATKGDLPAAETELAAAAKQAPQSPLPRHALGRVYAAQRKFGPALESFDSAIKIFPGFPAPHLEKGSIYASQGDDTLALKEYAEAQRLDPKRSAGITNIGMVHQRHAAWADAEKAYLEAVRIEPTNGVAYNNLAWMAADRKVNLAQAATWAKKAVELGPKVPEFHGTLAWVYRAQGNLAGAEKELQTALVLNPKHALITYNLARVQLEMGKMREGIAGLKKAVALQSDFPGADDARKKLKELGQG